MAEEKGELFAFPAEGIETDAYLELAKKWNMEEVLILGWDDDGNLCLGGNQGKLADINWLLERARHWVQEQADG